MYYEERDFFKQPLTEQEIKDLLKRSGKSASELFSWRSPQVKALGLEGKKLSEEEMVRLMAKEPRLIRRPFMVVGDKLLIGPEVTRA